MCHPTIRACIKVLIILNSIFCFLLCVCVCVCVYLPNCFLVFDKADWAWCTSVPEISPTRVWNTRKTLVILNIFSLPFLCRSTNSFRLRWSCSNCHKLRNLSSSSSNNCSSLFYSDSFSLSRSCTCTRELYT